MQELRGDIWDCHAHGGLVAITTGGLVDSQGACVMPRGLAAQARAKFPGTDKVLGGMIREHGNHVYDLGNRIIAFPVEQSPYEVPDFRLIERSCTELLWLVTRNGWRRVVVPHPGCGSGGLEWCEVRRVLARYFDDRFHIITQD